MGQTTSKSSKWSDEGCSDKKFSTDHLLSESLTEINEQLREADAHEKMSALANLSELLSEKKEKKSSILSAVVDVLKLTLEEKRNHPDVRSNICALLLKMAEDHPKAGAPLVADLVSLEIMLRSGLLEAVKTWKSDSSCLEKTVPEQLLNLLKISESLSHAVNAIRSEPKAMAIEQPAGGGGSKSSESVQAPDAEMNPKQVGNIKHSDLIYDPIDDFVAEGGFGKLYRAHWKGKTVAYKKLIQGPSNIPDLLHEGQMMSTLHHENIVNFFGFCMDPSFEGLIMEFITGGSLYGFLYNDLSSDITWFVRLKLAYGMTQGLLFLHQQNIFHRDIKSLNILVAPDNTAKIADFGLSKFFTKEQVTQSACQGSYLWMAPELFSGEAKYSVECDTYSLSCVFYELASREVPWDGLLLPLVLLHVMSGLRPGIPADSPPKFSELISKCWAHDRTKRPPLEDVSAELKTMLTALAPT
jgi:hypothetical protein